MKLNFIMAKGMIRCGRVQNWVEVAPSLLKCHHYQKYSSTRPKLETIVEEGSENFEMVQLPNRVSLFIPVFLMCSFLCFVVQNMSLWYREMIFFFFTINYMVNLYKYICSWQSLKWGGFIVTSLLCHDKKELIFF